MSRPAALTAAAFATLIASFGAALADPAPDHLEGRQLPIGTKLILKQEYAIHARVGGNSLVAKDSPAAHIDFRHDATEVARVVRAGTIFTVERVGHSEATSEGGNWCGTNLYVKSPGGWPLTVQLYGGTGVVCAASPKAKGLESVFTVDLPQPVIIDSAEMISVEVGEASSAAELEMRGTLASLRSADELTLFHVPLGTTLKLKADHYIAARESTFEFGPFGEAKSKFTFRYDAAETDRKILAGTELTVMKVVQYENENWCGVMLHVQTAKGWKMKVQGYGGGASCNGAPPLAPLSEIFDVSLLPPVVIESIDP